MRPEASWGWTVALACALGAFGCADRSDRGGPPGSTTSATPRTAAPPAPSSSAPRPALPPGSRPALRDDTAAGPATDGVVLELRSLRGRVASVDGLGLALRTRPAPAPSGPGAGSGESVDWSRALSSLRVEVKDPAGTITVLQISDGPAAPPSAWPLHELVQTLTVDGAALAQGAMRRPWKAAKPGMLDAPGTYAVTVAGTFATATRTLELRSGTVTIDVGPAGPAALALVDLERAASTIARATWGVTGIPAPSHPTVDDVGGAVSVRFQGASSGEGGTGYDVDVLEVWLDRAGKTVGVDAFRHFQCVAEGTRVETPAGAVPIEDLVLGAEVRSFDVTTGTPAIARVLRIDRGHAETLHVVGELRVTAEHPVWFDGGWTRAGSLSSRPTLLGVDLRPVVVDARVSHAPATVFDITVTPPGTYFAGGLLVHNKAAHVPLGGDRPWGPLFWRRAAAARAP